MSSSTSTKCFPSTSLSAALAIWEPASARQRPMLFAASVMDSTWYRSILSAVSSARSTISSSEWASIRMSARSKGGGEVGWGGLWVGGGGGGGGGGGSRMTA